MKIQRYNEIDIEKLSIGEKKGSKYIILYDGEPLVFKSPKMKSPFALSSKKTKQGKIFMKTITFSMENINKHVEKFSKVIQDIDDKIQSLMNRKNGVNGVLRESLYQNNPKYPATYRVDIRFEYGTDILDFEAFDAQNNNIESINDYIFERVICSSLIKLDSVWEYTDTSTGEVKYGINWFANQGKIYEQYQNTTTTTTTNDTTNECLIKTE